MKKLKRMIALIMSVVMLLTTLAGCGGIAKEKTDVFVTRGEWITMLGQQFGMDEYVSDDSFFQDVTQEDDIFPYVQSCVEWGVLGTDDNKTFKPNDIARVEFAVECGLRAANITPEDESLLDYAVERGILPDGSYMSIGAKLSKSVAEMILEWALEECLTAPFEEHAEVKLADDVVLLNQENGIEQVEENVYSTKENPEQFKPGDTVIMPGDAYNPDGVAKKVTDVYKDADGNYVITTEEANIDEICENVDVAVTAIPAIEDIQVEEGVTLSTNAESARASQEEYCVSRLANGGGGMGGRGSGAAQEKKGLDFGVNINFTKGTIKPNMNWSSLFGKGESVSISAEEAYSYRAGLTKDAGKLFEKSSVIPDRKFFGSDPYDNTEAIDAYKAGTIGLDELKKKLDLSADQHEKEIASMSNKFSGGYEVVGSLSVKNLYIQPQFQLKKVLGVPTGLKSFELTINYEVTASLAIKGKLSEELTVCTIPVPIASTGVTVDLKLALFVDVNGELKVAATVTNMTKTVYEDGRTKKLAEQSSSLKSEGVVQADAGPKFAVVVRFMGIGIVDADVKCAVRIKASGDMTLKTEYEETEDSIRITRQSVWGYGVDGFIPIISVGIGNSSGTLANKLRLNFSWVIVGEKKAYKFTLVDRAEIPIWEEEQVIPKTEETSLPTVDDETPTNSRQNKPWIDYLTIDRYYISLEPNTSGTVTVTNIPAGYGAADLVWESADSEIAAVQGGMITGGTEGVTAVVVRTADGVYMAQCTVTVTASSSAFEFIPLEDFATI